MGLKALLLVVLLITSVSIVNAQENTSEAADTQVVAIDPIEQSRLINHVSGKDVSRGFIKKVDLSKTVYCKDETRLDHLDQLSFVDEKNLIDRVVISKTKEKLYLISRQRIYKSYDVAFGFGFENGPKVQVRDGRTPEGLYSVELKNPFSAYHLSLRTSYPNADDIAFAKKHGLDPGGDIMIHGFPDAGETNLSADLIPRIHSQVNWTQGCIAVTNEEIEEIFKLVRNGTPIEICPRAEGSSLETP